MTNKPIPKVYYREVDRAYETAARQAGYDPWVAKIAASRPMAARQSVEPLLSPKLKYLDNPSGLPDLAVAVNRMLLALAREEVIGIETDHDCDGQTSHAVIYLALTEGFGHPPERIQSYIGHRLKEGYGLSEKVVMRILAAEPRPSLIVTADNGSSDEARIAMLKAEGIDVIVTDHHEIPEEGIPTSALAVVNPIRSDSTYPDRAIAGCLVAWLLMMAVRRALQEKTGKTLPSLAHLLDFVAVGTIADCVSMAKSGNNRAVVSFGMKLIEKAERPCWQALRPVLSFPLSSEDLGFKIGPLLNSDGRLSCAFGSVSFLLAKNREEAERWVVHLQEQNQARKAIQEQMTQWVLEEAKRQYQAGNLGLCIFLPEGHPGVHGICASRVKEAFGRPVIIFSPKQGEEGVLTGSGRSIDQLHLRQTLQAIVDQSPDIIIRFGGHQGAAGLSIHAVRLTEFQALFESEVKHRLTPTDVGPIIWVDGALSPVERHADYLRKIVSQLEPFGREFEPPIFEIFGEVVSIAALGEKAIHARLGLRVEGRSWEGVWFQARENAKVPWSVAVGDWVRVLYSPKFQTYRGEERLSYQVVFVIECDVSQER